MTDRQTVSSTAWTDLSEEERAAREAENALLQFDEVLDLIDMCVRDGRPFKLRPSTILGLHRRAMADIDRMAGTWRNAPVTISGSMHQPPPESLVPSRVEEMCDWVNDNWDNMSAVVLCAYVMWRLNWIHPFSDGNGRTTRAVAYLVLCCRAGARLPGTPTIPEMIAEDKAPYYEALEQADSLAEREDGLAAMTGLIEHYLTRQLESVLHRATGAQADDAANRRFH